MNDIEPICGVTEPPSWSGWIGLPPRSERTWVTLCEMQELLGREGLRVTREMAAAAVATSRPEKYRAWNCYEPKHVAEVRKLAMAAALRPARKRICGMHGR